jgi:hypothetical protein
MTAMSLSLLALLLLAMPASAGVTWCRADPWVELNGVEVRIWVMIPAEYEKLVTGPIRVTVYAPNKVSKEITFLDEGFLGHGEEVRFKNRGKVNDDGTFPVDIKVKVPLNSKQLRNDYGLHEIPVLVEIIASDGQLIHVEGSNHGIHSSLELRGTD